MKSKVSKELLEAWKFSERRGDLKILTEVTGLNPRTLRKALSTGDCTEEVKNLITGFFESRIRSEKRQAEFLKNNIN